MLRRSVRREYRNPIELKKSMSKLTSQKWRKIKIGDVCDVGRGSSPRPIMDPRYFEGGTIPWIKIADATKSGKYLYETKEKVNEYGASFSRLLPKGSLIVAASGTLGYTQMLGIDGCIHDGWLYLTNFKEADKDFLFYLFKYRQVYFANQAYGAAIQNVNTTILRDMEVSLPPFPTQHRIASILSTYDDLIENNTRRIQILEEMAQRLYREWFVYFRFPGHEKVKMVRGVPEGWEVKRLGDVVEEVRRSVDPTEIDPDTPYFGLEHLPRKSIALSEWGKASEVQSSKLEFKKGEILFGKIRPYFHKVGVAPIDGVCSSDTIVIASKAPKYFSVVLACISSEEFVNHATQTSQGTKMPRANWNVLVKYPILIPPQPIYGMFDELMQNVVAEITNLLFRNRNLRRTRDMLLPKLVSGEVEVEKMAIDIE